MHISCKIINLVRKRSRESVIVFCTFISLIQFIRLNILFDGYDEIDISKIEEHFLKCNVTRTNLELPFCDVFPKNLKLYTPVIDEVTDEELDLLTLDLKILPGGLWRPSNCISSQRVAIIVPYRNRPDQLNVFLNHMHKILQKQLIDYQIFVVEQTSNKDFNRGVLLNIGFVEASRLARFCCFIFSDVDLLPESPKNMYSCSKNPRHMSVSVDTFRYVLTYQGIFGGVISISKDQFVRINGFSNRFFGWGGEDDNFLARLTSKGLRFTRWDSTISRYTMLFHQKEIANPNRHRLLSENGPSQDEDGLSNIKNEYTVLEQSEFPLYTWFNVDLEHIE